MNNQLPTIPEEIVLESAVTFSQEQSVSDLPPAPKSQSPQWHILFGF